jgi:polyhydroxybutyrate depolymerase
MPAALLRTALALVLLSHAFGTTAHAQARRLMHRGEARRYIVYTPNAYVTDSTRAYPVVLNFHGGGMTMAEQMLYTWMNRTAEAEGFIVVYPQGLRQDWNVGFGTSYARGTDDVGFIEALLDDLQRDFRVDTRRIYATGLSRGAFFCHRLAAELSHRIAAVATVGAPVPIPVVDSQRPRGERRPVGVMLVHGTADRIVAYAGKGGSYLSATDSYAYWVERNGLRGRREEAARIDPVPDDGTSITLRRTRGGAVAVALYTVEDGGHTWVGADPFNVGLAIGPTSRDLDLNATIWRFLSMHTR